MLLTGDWEGLEGSEGRLGLWALEPWLQIRGHLASFPFPSLLRSTERHVTLGATDLKA